MSNDENRAKNSITINMRFFSFNLRCRSEFKWMSIFCSSIQQLQHRFTLGQSTRRTSIQHSIAISIQVHFFIFSFVYISILLQVLLLLSKRPCHCQTNRKWSEDKWKINFISSSTRRRRERTWLTRNEMKKKKKKRCKNKIGLFQERTDRNHLMRTCVKFEFYKHSYVFRFSFPMPYRQTWK